MKKNLLAIFMCMCGFTQADASAAIALPVDADVRSAVAMYDNGMKFVTFDELDKLFSEVTGKAADIQGMLDGSYKENCEDHNAQLMAALQQIRNIEYMILDLRAKSSEGVDVSAEMQNVLDMLTELNLYLDDLKANIIKMQEEADAFYASFLDSYNKLNSKVAETELFIKDKCPNVADKFAEDIAAIKKELQDLKNLMEESRSAGTVLMEGSNISRSIDWLNSSLDELKANAEKAENEVVTSIDGIAGDNRQPQAIYSVSGKRLSSMRKGINIVKFNDGTVKRIVVR